MTFSSSGGLDAVKTEFPHLIECPAKPTDDELTAPPATPETIDKENFVMTEIMPQIFVGKLERHSITKMCHSANNNVRLSIFFFPKEMFVMHKISTD